MMAFSAIGRQDGYPAKCNRTGVVVSTITCVLAGVEVAGGPLSQADIKVGVNTHNRATR